MTEEVEVELDIFSGRPNPAWRLSQTEVAGFLGRLAALAEAAPNEPEMPLGYRGFVVRLMQGRDASDLRVRNGIVRLARAGRVVWYGDPGRAMERSLLESGRAHLADDLYRLVLEDWR